MSHKILQDKKYIPPTEVPVPCVSVKVMSFGRRPDFLTTSSKRLDRDNALGTNIGVQLSFWETAVLRIDPSIRSP